MFRKTVRRSFSLTTIFLLMGVLAFAAGNYPQPTIVTRAEWSARTPTGTISQMSALNRAVIHHSAISSDYNTTSLEDSKAKVRAIQNYHMDSNGWFDVGYHFLTDKLGNSFEGRQGSINTLPRGTHDGTNDDSFGFCMMGYFHSPYNDQPTQAHRDILYDTIAWRIPDPFDGYGSGLYGGNTEGFLIGHRDAGQTACPGDIMYNTYIGTDYFGGEARNEVNTRITGGGGGTPGTEIIVDNDGGAPGYSETGSWSTSGSAGYNNGTYRWTTTGGAKTATWSADLTAGDWQVEVIYRAGSNRPTAASYQISAASGTQSASVNQTINDMSWVSLGTYTFNAGTNTVTLDAGASTPGGTAAIADAVRFTQMSGGTPGEMRLAIITVFDDINDTTAIQNWVNEIASLNYNSVAVHCRYRGDATYFPNKTNSTYPNNEPRTSAAGSIDVLEEFTTRGQAAGLKVFAYVNAYLVTDGADSDFRSNHIVNTHPEWRTYYYNGGSPIVQTTASEGEGLWIDPAIPAARTYIADICGDIMSNYNCDGIILDRIRYPQTSFTRTNKDFGYHPDAVAAFHAQYGGSGTPDPYDSNWIKFRQDQITATVQEVYNTITSIDNNHILLAYPIGRFNDAINYNYQDWPNWLSSNAIDGVLPQIYTSDNVSFSSRVDTHKNAYTGDRLLGITTMAYVSGVDVDGQIQIVRDKELDGTSPFRHGSMGSLGYFTDLQNAYTGTAPWPDMPWKGSDTTPPVNPTGLSATSGDGTVALNWSDNGEADLAGYNVYRSTTSGGPYTKLNASLVSSSAYTDNSVSNFTTYYYVVTAVDTSSNESGNSAQVSATPEDTTPPAVPTGLSASAGDATVSLDWNDNGESDLAGYNVYRGTTSGGPYSVINGSLVTSSAYTDNSVSNGTTYYYRVSAVDNTPNANESGTSSEVSATPTAPSGDFRIEAEDYTGYFDTTAGNTGGAYRSDDVDIEVSSQGGYNVGWIAAGEWLDFANAPGNGGSYDVTLSVASASSGGIFHIEVNGQNVTGRIEFPGTGGWQTWTTVDAGQIEVSSGDTIRLVMDSASWNVDWIDFVEADKSAYIDLDNYTISSYAGQDVNPSSYDVMDDGYTINMYGNTWKRITVNYTLTPNTVIEFDYKSDGTEHEIGGIAFDNDDSLAPNESWKVYGTQNWGITTYDNYAFSGNGWVTYTIPVGQTVTGTFAYLGLINDFDAGTGSNSYIRNIRIYEDSSEVIVDNDNGSPAYTETGTWSTSGSAGYNGGTYRYASAGLARTATWNLNLPSSGNWKIEVIYRAGSNRTTSTEYNIATASGTQTTYINQTINDMVWVDAGTYSFNAGGGSVTVDASGSTGGSAVIADAVRATKIN